MSMFSSAINGFRSTVSNPKFYASARAGIGRAVAATQAYAPKILANPYGRIGVGAGAGYIAGASLDSKNRLRGGMIGGAVGAMGGNLMTYPGIRSAAYGYGSRAARATSGALSRLSRRVAG